MISDLGRGHPPSLVSLPAYGLDDKALIRTELKKLLSSLNF